MSMVRLSYSREGTACNVALDGRGI